MEKATNIENKIIIVENFVNNQRLSFYFVVHNANELTNLFVDARREREKNPS